MQPTDPPPDPPPQEAPRPSEARITDRETYERYLPLVRRIAMRTVRNVPPSVTFDDLIGAGWMGLIEALRRRVPAMSEEEFEAYASHRVRGAVLDHLRSLDPMSRKLRGASRQISNTIRQLTAKLTREPEEEEVASELGLELETYRGLLGEISQSEYVRVELTDFSTPVIPSEAGPDVIVSRRELMDRIADAIDQLPERQQIVMGLYYQEDCNFREIGEILGVTEARVCQIHTEAVHRVRARLEGNAESRRESGRTKAAEVRTEGRSVPSEPPPSEGSSKVVPIRRI